MEVFLEDQVRREVHPGEHIVPGTCELQGVTVGVAVDLAVAAEAGTLVRTARVMTHAAVEGGVLEAAAAQVIAGDLGYPGQRVEEQRRAEVVDGTEGGVEGLDALIVVDGGTGTQ
ncbi:hypothetical protein D9M68_931190 [compost metagenome]